MLPFTFHGYSWLLIFWCSHWLKKDIKDIVNDKDQTVSKARVTYDPAWYNKWCLGAVDSTRNPTVKWAGAQRLELIFAVYICYTNDNIPVYVIQTWPVLNSPRWSLTLVSFVLTHDVKDSLQESCTPIVSCTTCVVTVLPVSPHDHARHIKAVSELKEPLASTFQSLGGTGTYVPNPNPSGADQLS